MTSDVHTVPPPAAPAPRRRGAAVWWWVLALVVVGGLGVVFGRWAFVPPGVDTHAEVPATAVVTQVTVEQRMPLAVSAHWDVRPLGVGAASGTLTSLEIEHGGTVDVSDRVFTVDLRPVVVARGQVPAFRDLAQGSRGDDVTQLQEFLAARGHFTGRANGVFGPGTRAAVRAWQRSVGLLVDGVVQAGDLLFVDELPARVTIAEGFGVGTRIAPGDVVLSVLGAEPQFVAALPPLGNVDPGLPVEVTFDGEPVLAQVVGQIQDAATGSTMLELRREDGAPVCGDRCDLVPIDRAEASFPAHQVIVAPVSGPGLPAAAMWLDANGDPFVVLADDGRRVPVTILGQGQGRVVLDGVSVGDVVTLPHQDAADVTTTPGGGGA